MGLLATRFQREAAVALVLRHRSAAPSVIGEDSGLSDQGPISCLGASRKLNQAVSADCFARPDNRL